MFGVPVGFESVALVATTILVVEAVFPQMWLPLGTHVIGAGLVLILWQVLVVSVIFTTLAATALITISFITLSLITISATD